MKKKTWTEKRTPKPHGTQRTVPEGRNRYGNGKREADKKTRQKFYSFISRYRYAATVAVGRWQLAAFF